MHWEGEVHIPEVDFAGLYELVIKLWVRILIPLSAIWTFHVANLNNPDGRSAVNVRSISVGYFGRIISF